MRLVEFLKCYKDYEIVVENEDDCNDEYFRGTYSELKKSLYADFDVLNNNFGMMKYTGMKVVYIMI